MTTILRAPSPARFLSLVPHLAGFTPRESLVLVPFRGGRSLGVLRLDLPSPDEDEARFAATAIGTVCRVRDADGLAIVVYTDQPFHRAGTRDPARHTLVARVRARASDGGLAVHGAHLVAADGWGSYGEGPACRPLAEIEPPPDVEGGLGPVSRDQHAGLKLPRVGKAARRRVAAAMAELQGDGLGPEPMGGHAAAHDGARSRGPTPGVDDAAIHDLPGVFEDALSWDPCDLHPAETAVLALSLGVPLLRDVALTQWSADLDTGRRTLAWQLRFAQGDAGAPNEPVRLAGDGPRPDPSRLRRALELTRVAAASVPARQRVGPLASAAWLSWALGNSTHAGWYVSRALEIEPTHGLAGLIATMLANAYLPAWAFERPPRRDA
ncbi:DUF4192 domain-containing protein [Microbacterium sp. Marseille-Q6965]|uniref:DUF4192 domain-containing protein n=1 Tax=Microbacterium sp. Marseille-Q6965 TaxID=2965072 RepID=UPI0021B818BA|nr:DUF4192 domain-containing protein [Microbacterium sp. Marseille-Q6965]